MPCRGDSVRVRLKVSEEDTGESACFLAGCLAVVFIRAVGIAGGIGHWYKAGEGLVEIGWVFVRDRTGTHRDSYLFSTDPTLAPQQVIETYTGRWSIETTFQEMRAYLGLETTRGWKERTVLRAAPCLFGLYSVVALL